MDDTAGSVGQSANLSADASHATAMSATTECMGSARGAILALTASQPLTELRPCDAEQPRCTGQVPLQRATASRSTILPRYGSDIPLP